MSANQAPDNEVLLCYSPSARNNNGCPVERSYFFGTFSLTLIPVDTPESRILGAGWCTRAALDSDVTRCRRLPVNSRSSTKLRLIYREQKFL